MADDSVHTDENTRPGETTAPDDNTSRVENPAEALIEMEEAVEASPEERAALAADVKAELSGMAKMWWLWLGIGIAWLITALVVLQFNTESAATVGIVVGAMFLFTGIQQFVLASVVQGWKWVWVLFGILFVLAGLWALFNPGATFLALADSLGFLFLLVGVFWAIEAFSTKGNNDLWWLSLVAAIIMIIIAFWVSGQFLIERAYTLLIFAGAWALMEGIINIIRAFQIRRFGKILAK